MISYMDLVQQCYYLSTGWLWDNTYEHILATPRNLLQFPIPNGVKLTISNQNTENNYSSINISQLDRLEGSLSYLSSSTTLNEYYKSSKSLPITNVIQGYRDIFAESLNQKNPKEHASLIYGKMYFPSQFLEGMLIKRFTPNYQLIVKFVNTPKLNKLTQSTSIFTFYLQRQTDNSAHDFIYSTREDLFGFRCLYHFDFLSSNRINPNQTLIQHHPSKLSAGCELWYAAKTISPGLSFAARYITYIDSMRYLINSLPTYTPELLTSNLNPYFSNHNPVQYAISTIHPLTLTVAVNPLLGTFESTYAIKSDGLFKGNKYQNNKNLSYSGKMGLVLSSKYQFNIYSFDSDLILGAQLLRSKMKISNKKKHTALTKKNIHNRDTTPHTNTTEGKNSSPYQLDQHQIIHNLSHISQHNIVYKMQDDEHGGAVPNIATAEDDDYISSLKVSGSVTK